MFWGLLAPDLLLISFSSSELISEGATISNSPMFFGYCPTFLIGLYFRILAKAIKSSSDVSFLLPSCSRSETTSRN